MNTRTLALACGLLVGVSGGCRYDAEITEIEPDADDYAIGFVLAAGTAVAGQEVDYTLTVTNHGEPVDDVRWTMASDREDYLSYDRSDVAPVVAGEHLLTVVVQAGDWTGTAQATLEVAPAEAYDLDLVLSDVSFVAGEAVDYEVYAVDRYGNGVDTAHASVTADSLDLTVTGDAITGVVPGVYLVTAIMDGLEDVEPVVIEAGPPAALEVGFQPQWPGLYETGSATVTVTDAYGNEVWAPWTLVPSRPAEVVVSGRNATFYAEGWHQLVVSVPGTALSQTIGPFLIDDTGPVITPTWPDRGQWTTAVNETIRGTVVDAWSSVSLSVMGTPTPIAPDGSYAVDQAFPWGVTVVEIDAVDGNGNASNTSSAVLAGSFLPYGARTARGIEARIQEGPGGTGTLEAIGEDLIDSQDIAGIIPNPVFTDREDTCWEVCLPWWLGGGCWNECIVWYSISLSVNDPSIGPSDLLIDPRADGTVLLRAVVEDPRIPWSASGDVVSIGYSASGAITADKVVVDIVTRPTVVNETIQLELVSVDTSLVGFDFNFDSWIWDVLSFFGLDGVVNDLIRDPLEDAVTDAVRQEVPPLVADALNDLELLYSFDLGGRTVTLDAAPTSIGVNDVGMAIRLGTRVTVDQWIHADRGLGSLYGQFASPRYPRPPHMHLAFNVDLLNQIAYAAWGAGLLDLEEPLSDLGLPEEELQTFLPGVTSITATVDPLLPPVVVPGTGGDAYDLQLGDLELTLYNGPVEDDDVLIRVYVTAIAGLDLGVVGDDRLSAEVGNADLWFDVTVPDGNTEAAVDTELLLEALIPLLLPRVTDVFGEIEIPSISGFGVTGVGLRTAGEDDAWLVVGGDLVVQ